MRAMRRMPRQVRHRPDALTNNLVALFAATVSGWRPLEAAAWVLSGQHSSRDDHRDKQLPLQMNERVDVGERAHHSLASE